MRRRDARVWEVEKVERGQAQHSEFGASILKLFHILMLSSFLE